MHRKTAEEILRVVEAAYPDEGLFSKYVSGREVIGKWHTSSVRLKMLAELMEQPEPSKAELRKFPSAVKRYLNALSAFPRPSAWEFVYQPRKQGRHRAVPFETASAICNEVDNKTRSGEKWESTVADVAKEHGIGEHTLKRLLHQRRIYERVERELRIQSAIQRPSELTSHRQTGHTRKARAKK